MASAVSNDVVSLQAQVEHLRSEVLRLQKKQGELHVSDVGALRRAHATLSQHVQALYIEAQGIAESISGLDTEVERPDEIGEELGALGTVVAAAFVINRVLRFAALPNTASLGRAVWLAGAAYEVYRLANGVLRRLCAFTVQNARRKQQLLDDWRVLQSYQVLGTTGGRRLQGRIDIMADLANWAPPQAIAAAAALQPPAATGQSRGAQEGSPRDAQAGASAPSAPMWPGGGGDAAGCGGGDPEGGPAPGRGHAAAAAAAVDGERGAVQRRMVPGRQL